MDVQTLNDMTEVVRACRTQGGTIDEQMAALAARTARAERMVAKTKAENAQLQDLYEAASRRADQNAKRAAVAEQCQDDAEKALFYWRYFAVIFAFVTVMLAGTYLVAASNARYWQTKAENPTAHNAVSRISYDYDLQKAVVWYK